MPERAEPWVVGFSGLGVEGATAMRSPIFERPEGRYFVGDPDAVDAEPCSHEELVAHEQRGLATLTIPRRRWRRVPGGVLLYAHADFVAPEPGLLDLASTSSHLEGLDFDERLRLYVSYFPRNEALARLAVWARALLDDSRDALWLASTGPTWERALDSATRARIAAPPPEHPDLRREAFVLMGAAWCLLKRDWKDMLWMARMDRNAGLLDTVERESPQLAESVRNLRSWKADPRVVDFDRRVHSRRRSLLNFGDSGKPEHRAA